MSKREIKLIENISVKNSGILFDGKWHDVVGNAVDYLKDLQKGQNAEIGLDSNGDVVFIKQEQTSQGQPNTYAERNEIEKLRNKQIRRQALLNTSVEMLKEGKKLSPKEVIETAKELEQWIKEVGEY